MHRLLVVSIGFWLSTVPVACLAGVFQHPCADCVESLSCDHEDDCADDPCGTQALRPEPPAGERPLGSVILALNTISPIRPSGPRSWHVPAKGMHDGRDLGSPVLDLSLPLLI